MASKRTKCPSNELGHSDPEERNRIDDPDEYFMAVACLTAKRSKDPNTKVGACIVNQEEGKVVGIGYNSMPNGCEGKLSWKREAKEWIDKKYPYVCHAELNAIMNKYSADVKGCTVFVTLFPCNECTKLIIQAGITKVVYLSDKYHDMKETVASRRMLEQADIQHRQFIPTGSKITIDFNAF